MKVVSLVGARPQFIKEAMVNAEVRKANAWRHILGHSGQHYDFNMSEAFFEELEIPHPDYWLGIESGSQAAQTADAILKFNRVLADHVSDLLFACTEAPQGLARRRRRYRRELPNYLQSSSRLFTKFLFLLVRPTILSKEEAGETGPIAGQIFFVI